MSYSSMLLSDMGANDAARGDIQEISDAAERAASLTRQLLAFSRKQVLQMRAVNVNAVVTDVEKMLRRLIGEDILLNTHLDADLALINADPGQLEQVLINLAVNARDAMPGEALSRSPPATPSLPRSMASGIWGPRRGVMSCLPSRTPVVG